MNSRKQYMLPILPAILLLLFQGPANYERLALEGRLPAALEAIQRMEQPRSTHESEALATLLASTKDPELTKALFAILKWVEEPAAPKPLEAPAPDSAVPIPDVEPTPLQDGFTRSQRSRDGPSVG